MKKIKHPNFIFTIISCIAFLYSCTTKEIKEQQKISKPESLQLYRNLFESNSLTAKNFYNILNKYEKLLTDSLISSNKNITHPTSLKASLTTSLNYCSISGKVIGTGNDVLLQIGSNGAGQVKKSAFGIIGKHGAVNQIEFLEQGVQHQGVSIVRIYLKGMFDVININNPVKNSALTQIFVVSSGIINGCPVVVSAIPLPQGTEIIQDRIK